MSNKNPPKKYLTFLITNTEEGILKNIRNLKFGRILLFIQDGKIIDKEITIKEKIQKTLRGLD